MKGALKRLLFILVPGSVLCLTLAFSSLTKTGFIRQFLFFYKEASLHKAEKTPLSVQEDFFLRLAKAAEKRSFLNIHYIADYVKIDYPGGDVPANTGVCTDLIIRSYRALGIDLQKEVNEDMSEYFLDYPKIWHLTKPDSNIDHRRVPNLMTYFNRRQSSLAISQNKKDYRPGDIVCWDLGGGTTHIGIVTTKVSPLGVPMIVDNIGLGPRINDCLFKWRIIGHFRFSNF